MTKRAPTFGESVFSILSMVVIIAVGYAGFGIRVEMLMIISAIVAALVARRCGYRYAELESGICQKIVQATPAILIMWTIGIVIATFIFSGSIPMIIYYGLKLINPQYLYLCAFLVCCVLSTVTGTSWGSAGTMGVAMMGVAAGLGVPLHITAAAVISGAIFGDKLSPLSETTNLAPLCAGCNIYDHIVSMLYTTIPSAVISGIVFWVAGTGIDIPDTGLPQDAVNTMASLDAIYNWNLLLLLPFIVILVCAFTKQPPVPTMIGASLLAILIGGLYQGFDFVAGFTASVNGFTTSMIFEGEAAPDVAQLLNRGGMKSMVGIVIVIYCGYGYAAIISKAGFLKTALAPVVSRAKNRVTLIGATLITDFIIMACAGSSYPAHIMTAEMYKRAYLEQGLDPRVLSRTLEDCGTMMAPWIPWGTSGAFYIGTLGVGIFGMEGYGIWSPNTYLNPVFALIVAAVGIGMYKMTPEKQAQEIAQLDAQEKAL